MINFYADGSSSFFLIGLLVLMILFMFIGRNPIDKSRIHELSKKDFLDTKRKGTLVDVRKSEEFEKNKIVGAKNFPGVSGAKDYRIRKDIPIFIYDEKGKKAYRIAKKYVKNGAVMVYFLKGGFEEYLRNE